jgi:hypothetical protein
LVWWGFVVFGVCLRCHFCGVDVGLCVVLLSFGIGMFAFLFFGVIFVVLLGGDVLGVLCASCGMLVPFVSLLSFISLSPPSWWTILVLHF